MRDSFKRTRHVCPSCSKDIPDEYVEQNPFPEMPCLSCGALIDVRNLKDREYAASDERSDRRCAAHLKVSYRSYDRFISEYTKNVSRGGMFIRTRAPHKVHEIVEVSIEVPDLDRPLTLTCEVVRVQTRGVGDEDAGIGVRFLDISESSRKILISYIAQTENSSGSGLD